MVKKRKLEAKPAEQQEPTTTSQPKETIQEPSIQEPIDEPSEVEVVPIETDPPSNENAPEIFDVQVTSVAHDLSPASAASLYASLDAAAAGVDEYAAATATATATASGVDEYAATAATNGDLEEIDDDLASIRELLDPFPKEQLVDLLRSAAEKHPDVLDEVCRVADTDPFHRKIFVHGLSWDATTETLTSYFSQYGEIEDCKAVVDKPSGRCKGYGFILFKHRTGAYRSLREPQKKIGNRMTSCQLASAGPPQAGTTAPALPPPPPPAPPVSEYTQRKIFISNVGADIDPQKLVEFFSQFGEIEEGPLGLDKATGKPKGFALFVYRSVEGAKKALEEPHRTFEGHTLHCQKAIDGPKTSKQGSGFHGGSSGFNRAGHLMAPPPVTGMGFHQAAPPPAAATPGLNPALGHALTALLAGQGAGLGLTNILGQANPGPMTNSVPYGMQGVGNVNMMGGYGAAAPMQGGYGNAPMGRGANAGWSQQGGVPPYTGRR